MRPGAQPGDRALDRAGAEDQHRDIERQDEERDENPAAPSAERQRRADRTDEAETGRSERHGGHERAIARGVDAHKEGEEGRDDDERQTSDDPMRQDLRHDDELERWRGEGESFEGAVLVIGEEEAVEREQGGQQRGHPDNTGTDARQERRGGTDAEGKENDGKDEKADDHRGVAALAHRKTQIAPDNADEGAGEARRRVPRLFARPGGGRGCGGRAHGGESGKPASARSISALARRDGGPFRFAGHGQATSGGSDMRIASTLPPVVRPNSVPRS